MGLPQNNNMDPEHQRLEHEDKVPKPVEHPAVRTETEEALFKKALGSMELIYSMGNTPVIVLPMDGEVDAGMEYFSRGWWFFEFALAFSFVNIANAAVHYPVEEMRKRAVDLKLDTVEGYQEGSKETHFTNRGDETVVFNLFEKTLNKKVK